MPVTSNWRAVPRRILQAARDVDSSAIALLKNREQLMINEE